MERNLSKKHKTQRKYGNRKKHRLKLRREEYQGRRKNTKENLINKIGSLDFVYFCKQK